MACNEYSDDDVRHRFSEEVIGKKGLGWAGLVKRRPWLVSHIMHFVGFLLNSFKVINNQSRSSRKRTPRKRRPLTKTKTHYENEVVTLTINNLSLHGFRIGRKGGLKERIT